MASRDGIYYSTKKKNACAQYFVKEARYHPNGFTVYKVISRVPNPHSLDCFKESFVWKRYSDFRDLYKCLATLHRKLYLNGQIPEFAKPKLFGRFDESVVEYRRKSAELVLKFATEHQALMRSAVFKEFFQGLQPVDSTTEIKYLKQAPLKPNVRQERKSLESDPELNVDNERLEGGISKQDLELFDPFHSTKDFIDSTSTDQDQTWINQIKQSFSTNENQVEKPSDTENAYRPRELDSDDEEELLKALAVSIGQVDLQAYHKRLKEDQGLSIHSSENAIGVHSPGSSGNKILTNMDLERLYQDEAERDKHRRSSKASAYLEAVIKQNKVASEGNNATDTDSATASQSTLGDSLNNTDDNVKPLHTSKSDLPTRSSLLDLPRMFGDEGDDDESRGGYLIQAAQQISFARSAEIKLAYEEAFGHYKAAINTLLQGVQGDTNEMRIQAVRRKTSKYLKRAEDIHSDYLKSTGSQDLWNPDVKTSSPRTEALFASELQRTRQDTSSPGPNGGSPRQNSKELLNYKVLGTIGKVLLVLDARNNESYAMKILPKSSQTRIRKGVIPTNVPYMVRLHRYYSTDQAVCLVMEHASGGKLWDQLQPYFELCKSKDKNSAQQKQKDESLKVHQSGLSSTPISKRRDAQQDAVEDSTSVPSFLDVCMEYRTEDQDIGIPEDTASETLKEQTLPHSQTSKQSPLQRTLSYLSWDDPTGIGEDVEQRYVVPDFEVFGGNIDSTPPEVAAETLSDFKKISSQGDMKLFTIDPDEEYDDDLPAIDASDSHSNGDVSEEFDDKADNKPVFSHELLSEQDMSAVSLISGEEDGTLLANQEEGHRSANLSLSRILNESKSSPCLSINSSFEEDRRKNEADKETVTRIIDENGVSSVDAKTVFRTLSRSRSSASENRTLEKPDIVKDIVDGGKESFDEQSVRSNKVHTIFVEMDEAKKSSMSYRLPEYTVQRWAAEMIIAVGTLHSVAILCRDLNPNNILLSDDGHIRLSYFGKWRQVERKPCDKKAVSRLYVAPEMSQIHVKKTEACDWWSIGALLYELLTGRPLCEVHPAGISSHTILTLPDQLSLEAKSLLTGLLQYFPTQRLGYGIKGLDDLMNHSFFSDTEWDILIEECNGG